MKYRRIEKNHDISKNWKESWNIEELKGYHEQYLIPKEVNKWLHSKNSNHFTLEEDTSFWSIFIKGMAAIVHPFSFTRSSFSYYEHLSWFHTLNFDFWAHHLKFITTSQKDNNLYEEFEQVSKMTSGQWNVLLAAIEKNLWGYFKK